MSPYGVSETDRSVPTDKKRHHSSLRKSCFSEFVVHHSLQDNLMPLLPVLVVHRVMLRSNNRSYLWQQGTEGNHTSGISNEKSAALF